MTAHIPDELLMRQVKKHLTVTPLSIHQLKGITKRTSEEVRQALLDLEHDGKVRRHWDGCLWELAHGGYSPDPEPKGAA